MSCTDCSKKIGTGISYTKSRDGVFIENDVVTAAAMCAACPLSSAVVCSVDGISLDRHAVKKDCPKGLHPKGGVVKWYWIEWYGIPSPLRRRLRKLGKMKETNQLPGCGCIKLLKDFASRIGLI